MSKGLLSDIGAWRLDLSSHSRFNRALICGLCFMMKEYLCIHSCMKRFLQCRSRWTFISHISRWRCPQCHSSKAGMSLPELFVFVMYAWLILEQVRVLRAKHCRAQQLVVENEEQQIRGQNVQVCPVSIAPSCGFCSLSKCNPQVRGTGVWNSQWELMHKIGSVANGCAVGMWSQRIFSWRRMGIQPQAISTFG